MNESGLEFLTVIAVRTIIVLVVLTAGIRISGRRRIGELNLYDLVLVLVIANAVQNAMTKSSGRITVGLVAAGTLLVIGWLVAKAIGRWPMLEGRLMGTPTVVVQSGRLIHRNMRHEGVTENEVMAAARQQGLARLHDVKLAVLEPDGFISVVPAEHSGQG
ncbi:MAG TPA: YetF domain-containing protein [Gemmatimonadaceae bacterium]|nr:YetF domain-containing protein [Gemmatimonadaceae bacterium]